MKKTYAGFGNSHKWHPTITVDIKVPKWIRKAKKNRLARVKRYAKKHNLSIAEAESILIETEEENAQNDT